MRFILFLFVLLTSFNLYSQIELNSLFTDNMVLQRNEMVNIWGKSNSNEIVKIKSFVESFDNLFSIGAGGEFNYADSQILFHKSFDLVNSLTKRNDTFSKETKYTNNVTFNTHIT